MLDDTHIDYPALGKMIKYNREKLHISREELSEKVGISVNYLGQIEKSGSNKPSFRVVLGLFRSLGISLDDYFFAVPNDINLRIKSICSRLTSCSEHELGLIESVVNSIITYERFCTSNHEVKNDA